MSPSPRFHPLIVLPLCLLGGAVAGLTLRGNFSMPGFSGADQSPPNLAAPAAKKPDADAESAMLPITRDRLEAFRRAGTPSEQVTFALRFEGLDNIDEIRDLLNQRARFPSESPCKTAVAALLKSWLLLDPAAAHDSCLQHEKNFLPQLIGTWSRQQPEEAAAWLKTQPNDFIRQKAWFAWCHTMAVKNPAAAWENFAAIPGLVLNAGSFDARTAMARLVDLNVDQAVSALSTMSPSMAGPAGQAIAASLMRTDPARGWEWARSQTAPGPVLNAALIAAMRQDPARALGCLKSLSPEEFALIQEDTHSRWKTGDLPAAAALLKADAALPDEFRQFAARRLFEGSLYADPADCALLFPLLSAEAQLEKAADLSATWTDQDPISAQVWIDRLSDESLREAALKPLAVRQAAPDPNSPERLVAEFNAGGGVSDFDPRLLRLTASHLAQMMVNLEGEHFFGATQLIQTLSATQPETVASWLKSAEFSREISPIAKVFTVQWAAADPAAAATWVKTLPPDGPLALLAAKNAAFEYHRHAPEKATTWLNSLSPGPVQEAARAAMR